MNAYAPSRGLISKWRRRATQAKRARPATLRFARPILSICFDDFPHSAATTGALILEAAGGRGTYYASGGHADQDGPCGVHYGKLDLRRLAINGHEIGCHTYSHFDCAKRDVYETLVDLARNRDVIGVMGEFGPLQSLAYPYGETTPALKTALPPRYRTARGVMPGLNVGKVDLAHLRAYPLYGASFARAKSALKRAARRRAWMIAFTHDVADKPSPWGTTPEALEAFIAKACKLGFAILPVTEALERAE